ncbi:hypothetical protein B0T21DRAFT_386219 [Apiosordaria backusii]|uniref:Uncharacterized protein n=1 Tax=Apiosordaria backusii TaxID=314023 RepID=A0AA40ASN9_9PEZI|nr:hypothetical protein B0T21DRAFT_386219 [Apiosordaria backusii]
MSQTQNAPNVPFWVPNMMFPTGFLNNTHPNTIGSTTGIDSQGHPYGYVSGLHGTGRIPQPPPITDENFPAANLLNSTGGAGAEPGFNYFFPTEHANVIVLKSATAPWKLTEGYDRLDYWSVKVPSNVTMAELLVGFGARNEREERNAVFVVYQQGDGKWEHQETIRGDDEGMMRKSVRECGWVKRGVDGRVGVKYIWVVKG